MSKYAAFGTKLVFDPAGTPLTVGQIKDISGPSQSMDAIETTCHDSPSGAREFVPGLIDGGEVTLDIEFDPDTSQSAPTGALGILENKADDRATVDKWEIRWEPQGGTATYRRFDAIVTNFAPNGPVDGSITASVTLKITGPITSGTV